MNGIDSLKVICYEIVDKINIPFWRDVDFYIYTVLSIGAITLSWLAYKEATKAKIAAIEAGTRVKIQSITLELSEISQRLDKLDFDVDYSTARDLINGFSRKIRRMISPFGTHGSIQWVSRIRFPRTVHVGSEVGRVDLIHSAILSE